MDKAEERRRNKEKCQRWYERHKRDPAYLARSARNMARYLRDPCLRVRLLARKKAQTARQAGKIVKLDCVRCGSAKSEMHHEDYSKPLEILWLCRTCHVKEHNL